MEAVLLFVAAVDDDAAVVNDGTPVEAHVEAVLLFVAAVDDDAVVVNDGTAVEVFVAAVDDDAAVVNGGKTVGARAEAVVLFDSAGDDDVAVGKMYVAALRYAAIFMQQHHVPRATICAVIGVKSAQLERWIRYWRAIQSVWRVPERQNVHADSCWLHNPLSRAVLGLVREQPLALLREHSAMLTAMRSTSEFSEIKVSKSTVNRMLRRLRFTRKVIIWLYHAASPERRRQHAVLRQMAATRCIVSIDETHTDGRNLLRRCWRSL